MAITVRELTELPQLRTWIHAGAAGAERELTWAHVCELPDPWEWLTGGELVMTTGLAVPRRAADQVAYLERLADAGASALTIAERLYAPPLTRAMLEAADRLAFPVCFTGYEVRFIEIERAVAGAARRESRELLVRTMRVYEVARVAASEGLSGAPLLARLAVSLRCRCWTVSPARLVPLLPGESDLPAGLAAGLRAALEGRETPLPAVLHVRGQGERGVALPIATRRPALLLVQSRGARPDLASLQHVATLAALELEKLAAERERERADGAELLAQLVDRRLAPEAAAPRLEAHGLGEQLVLAACSRPGGGVTHQHLHHALAERGVPHLLLHRGETLLVLLPADAGTALRDELEARAAIGFSETFASAPRVPDAAREARWALEAAHARGVPAAQYGEDALAPFLPRTLSEAQATVDRVLGALAAYDVQHGTALLDSLETFLACNRSWQSAAAALSVHKQTLVYRMRRVEELTGRRLDRTDDVAELWLALRTRRASGGGLVAAGRPSPG